MITEDINEWVPFIGIVEDVADPKKVGRVKVRIINHHDDDLPTKDLDWSTPILPVTSASKQGIGTSPTFLSVGSMVIGFFLDGSMRGMPMILGTFPKIPDGDVKKHDVNKRARGINEIKNKKTGPEPAPAFKGKYPHIKTMSTESGHQVELDDTPGEERVMVRHKSGSYVEINKDGRVVIKSVDDEYIIAEKDLTSYSKGNSKFESKGKMTIKVAGKCEIIATGDCLVSSGTTLSLRAPVVDLMG